MELALTSSISSVTSYLSAKEIELRHVFYNCCVVYQFASYGFFEITMDLVFSMDITILNF